MGKDAMTCLNCQHKGKECRGMVGCRRFDRWVSTERAKTCRKYKEHPQIKK